MIEGSSIRQVVQQNDTNNASSSSSSWLKKVTNWDPRPRPSGCWNRPWVCRQREAPGTRMRCCRNRCIDVSSDVNNCGLCRIRCRFAWQCCRGFCTNINRNPFNCGRCGNRCPWGVRCVYGMCGYAQPWPRPCPQPPPRPPQPSPPRSCPTHPPRGDQPPPVMHALNLFG
ncbi:Stigma-specific protein Stig1 [Melia azedarach]|uniref:Stigma-specific protein Stig1 n=1 Tax=Melia azedarach TaxID=155640 RepID=A0ACC1YN18_MELAZ|nr:Stigma-specific protein Stig1 [Melia azedarach]